MRSCWKLYSSRYARFCAARLRQGRQLEYQSLFNLNKLMYGCIRLLKLMKTSIGQKMGCRKSKSFRSKPRNETITKFLVWKEMLTSVKLLKRTGKPTIVFNTYFTWINSECCCTFLRKQAQQWHPDNFQGDEESRKKAEKKFIDIAAAKEVLTDQGM